MELKAQNGCAAVRQTCHWVMAVGDEVERQSGERTKEIRNLTLLIEDPSDMLCTGLREDYLPGLAAAEALHLMAGTSYGEAARRITHHLHSDRWSEDVENYGLRLRPQMPGLLYKLKADPQTRQAVVTIMHPEDVYATDGSFRCATSLQFLVRDGRLHCTVTMRSNDAWHGLPYNLFAFGQLQCTIANCLGIKVGSYTHAAASMHLYERHWDKARGLYMPARSPKVRGLRFAHKPVWNDVQHYARALLVGKVVNPTGDEHWYEQALHGEAR